jgi:hypothetical protein
MNKIKRIALLMHIIDNTGKLDLVDLSFIAMVLKVVLAPGIDFPSVTALVGVILAKMHRFHVENRNGKETIVDEDQVL